MDSQNNQAFKSGSLIVKRSVKICGHSTSVSLEQPFWDGLKAIAAAKDMTLSELLESIELERRTSNLSSTLRLFVLAYYREEKMREAA